MINGNRLVRFVVFRYGHHSPHSGYSRLAEYGAKQFNGEIIRVNKPLPKSIIRERILWRLARGTPGYDRSAMAAELQVASHILREGGVTYHFLYGEKNYHYVGQLNNYRDNRLVATFHMPPGSIQKSLQVDWHIKQLSAVVCVGRNQQEYFGKIIDPASVYFVPLGIDTEYYTPPSSFVIRDPNLCLFVGDNFRDFPTLRGVVELVAYMRPSTKFIAVTPQRNQDLIGIHPNLTYLTNIPESQFLDLYRSASLLVLPLQDATANNAVLESMACGLPMVTTDVGATRDYVSKDCAELTPQSNARYMAEVVVGLLSDPSKLISMSENARAQAVKFSWPEVVKQLEDVYLS